MTSTNRLLNRAILLVVGLGLLTGGGATILLWSLPDAAPMRGGVIDGIVGSVPRIEAWQVDLAGIGLGSVPLLLILIPLAALVLIVLVCVFAFAQGRGRTREVLRLGLKPAPASGAVDVDVSVAAAVIGDTLAGRRDIVDAQVSAYRVRGRVVLKVTVSPRRGADIEAVLEQAATTAEGWNSLLGRQVPMLVHLTRGSWSGLRREGRVA